MPASYFYSRYCNNAQKLKIPDHYRTESTEADLLIFVGNESMAKNYKGYAGICLLSNI